MPHLSNLFGHCFEAEFVHAAVCKERPLSVFTVVMEVGTGVFAAMLTKCGWPL
jgi:hypothetical protein